VRPHPMKSRAPAIKVIIDAQGEVLENPQLMSLIAQDGSRQKSIVATVDPILKNVDIGGYFVT